MDRHTGRGALAGICSSLVGYAMCLLAAVGSWTVVAAAARWIGAL